jgi:hypothetical protein
VEVCRSPQNTTDHHRRLQITTNPLTSPQITREHYRTLQIPSVHHRTLQNITEHHRTLQNTLELGEERFSHRPRPARLDFISFIFPHPKVTGGGGSWQPLRATASARDSVGA